MENSNREISKFLNYFLLKFSPSLEVGRGYIVLNFGKNTMTEFREKGGQSSKFAPYISETGGSWGSKFLSPIGDQGV